MRVEAIWAVLEQDISKLSSGYLSRRILPEVEYDVYLAIENPSNNRLLMLRVNDAYLKPDTVYPSFKNFEIRQMIDQSNKGHTILQLLLKDSRFNDIFTVLVQDVVNYLESVPKARYVSGAFLTRLKRWQAFLEHYSYEGLSESAQQGIYGELWFLRKAVLTQLKAIRGVLSWAGPRGAQQDFQFEQCAVEVKTSISKQHQKLTISSERQLDSTGTGSLILLHLSLDARHGRGDTLPDMVNSLRSLLKNEPEAAERFEALLFEAGYLDIHAAHYKQNGYTIREINYFKVEGAFPRIVEADLRNGVGDVRYTIGVAECKQFSVTESEVLSLMRGSNE